MAKKKTKIVKKSDKRKRDYKAHFVRFSEDEYSRIQTVCDNTNLDPITLMRDLALGYKPKSTHDIKVALELAKLRSELGKIGGLIKLSISAKPIQVSKLRENLKRLNSSMDEINKYLSSMRKKRL